MELNNTDYQQTYQSTGEKQFYDEHYNKKGNAAMRPDWVYDNWFKLLQPVTTGEKILDVACGTGSFLKMAVAAGLQAYGLELSDEAVRLSRANVPQAEIVQGYGEALPYSDAFFSYISCLGSLEHFSDPVKGLSEMRRVGGSDARYLIVLPNDNYWLWKWTKVAKGTKQRNWEMLKDLPGWKDFLTRGGFEIISVHQDKYPASEVKIFSSMNPIKILRRLLFRCVWLCLPLSLTYQFVFVLKKHHNA
jgi:SAM-dependent methyltransferase